MDAHCGHRCDAWRPLLLERSDGCRDDPRRQVAAVPLDHEGRFRVQATIDGPLGPAVVDSTVDATYDSRPPPIMLGVYAIPFVIVGFLWLKLLLRRRRGGVVRTR